ncbi:glycosyltransferase family 4 protein [Patescibacteria group bacterium]|nr:glycosyltransferase family 4 protein [Patescibacteria group bacterium]
MSVLFVTRKYPPEKGGMETFSYELFKHLKTKKKLIALKKPNAHLIWFLTYAFTKTLINAHKYDTILYGDAVFGFMAKIIKKLTKKPTAIAIHGLDITHPSKLHQTLNVNSLKHADSIVAVSTYTKALAEKSSIPSDKISVIPNGIVKNMQPFIFPKPRIFLEKLINRSLENKKVIVSLGRLVKRKGFLWFVKNVAEALPQNIVYIIVGNGPEKSDIINAIQQKKLENVFLVDSVSDMERTKLYTEADLFIMPNITVNNDPEGFGIVALEAASHGTPVVASNIQGTTDAVKTEMGVLISEKSKTDFLRTITSLLDDDLVLRTLSKSAYTFTNYYCTWDKVAKQYESLLEKITTS